MVEIQIRYEGGLRTRAVHGPSSVALLTDAPLDNHGKGESFSPTDLVATALGTCMLTTMGLVAERHGWKIEGSRVRVEEGPEGAVAPGWMREVGGADLVGAHGDRDGAHGGEVRLVVQLARGRYGVGAVTAAGAGRYDVR